MKKSILTLCAATLLTFSLSSTSFAQVKLPQASSTTSITQGLGIKNLSLSYQRPNINGRVIFGGLVPYNEVWRTGANNIPVIKFEEEVTIEGNKVPAGTYGILTIPTQGEWTIILTKNSNQWGAYTYDPKQDVVDVTVPVNKLADKQEWFEITLNPTDENSGNLVIKWDMAQAEIALKPAKPEAVTKIAEKLKEIKK